MWQDWIQIEAFKYPFLSNQQLKNWIYKTENEKEKKKWNDKQKDIKDRKRLKWRDTGAESFWPLRRRSYQRVAMAEWLLCRSTCRRGRCWDLLNRLDRDFLRCLMELTLFYLCAISARALYAKRQSTSVDPAFAKKAPPQPFQCVPGHRWVIDKNVAGQGQCDKWESLPQTLNRLSGVKQARATEY